MTLKRKTVTKIDTKGVEIMRAKSGIAALLETGGFSIAKVLAVQSRIQAIVPAGQREPDHILVILREVGEHLGAIEPIFKDWHKEGDMLESDIDWDHAAEELADVLILQARALIGFSEYIKESEESYLRADLLDTAAYLGNSSATKGQLILSSLVPFLEANTPFRDRTASLYFTAQYASLLPFGVSGLKKAWEQKVAKVVRRKYSEIG